MFVKINGKTETIEGRSSLSDVVRQKDLNPDRIVIERNLEIIPKEKWPEVFLNEKDSVEIITFMGGG